MSVQLLSLYGYFPRQGAIIGAYNYVASLYGSAIQSDFQAIWTQFLTSDQASVENLPSAVEVFRQSGANYQSVLVQSGTLASILQVNDDTPLVPLTYQQSINVLRQQMIDSGNSINRPTLGSSVTPDAGNIGDTTFYVSMTNIYGDPLDMKLNVSFTATCVSQGSGFQASFTIVGQPAVSANSWNWPQGSGAQASVTVNDPAVDGIVLNGSFETFTVANTPDNWTIVNGSAGVTVFESSGGGVRSGTNAVYLQSDGSSTTQLSQNITLSINTVYAVTFQAKMNSNSASGTLVVAITDGSGNILDNDAGTALSATYALNGGGGEITTSYQQLTVFFSTPRQLPSTVQIRAGYGVAAVSTRQLFLDLLQVFQPTPLYGAAGTGTSGPFVAGVANTAVSAVDDFYTIAFTNTLGTQSFVMGLERLYGLRELGLYLPSATSETIPDNLVTHP